MANRSDKTLVVSANTSWYIYNFRGSTIRALKDEGYDIICLAPEDDYSSRLVSELGCEWLSLSIDNQGGNPLRDINLFYQFFNCYRTLMPVATLHFTIKNNIYGTMAARLLGIPAINNISGLGTAFLKTTLVTRVARFLYRFSQRFAYRVFCQNEDDYQQIIEMGLVSRTRLELVPGSGVNTRRFDPRLRRGHSGAFRLLYAGRMLYDKGLLELIEAVENLNNSDNHCVLWLSGFADVDNSSAISEDQLRQWSDHNAIKWLGPSDNMEQVYSQVDCVVLPSYREGMPRSLLEAGAMGLPVVATDVPGCRNIIEHEFNGLLCKVKSVPSLQHAIQRMMTMSSEERNQLALNGRRLVTLKFDERIVVDATLKAIDSARHS